MRYLQLWDNHTGGVGHRMFAWPRCLAEDNNVKWGSTLRTSPNILASVAGIDTSMQEVHLSPG